MSIFSFSRSVFALLENTTLTAENHESSPKLMLTCKVKAKILIALDAHETGKKKKTKEEKFITFYNQL